MMSGALPINSKSYKILGLLVSKKHPEIARSLLDSLSSHAPLEKDISKMEFYFNYFCQVQGIIKAEYFGPVFKTPKVDVVRVFIASMIHLYHPEIHSEPIEVLDLQKTGFVAALARVTGKKESNVSGKIRDAIAWERDYEDFRDKVRVVVQKLTAVA